MDGGWKSHGHRPGQLPQPAPPPQRRTRCSTVAVVHGPAHAASCTTSNWRMGKVHPRRRASRSSRSRPRSTTTCSRRPVRLPAEARVGVDATDRATFLATQGGLERMPSRRAAQDLPVDGGAAPDDLGAGRRGRGRARARRPRTCYEQQLVPVEGQTDILTMGIPYICPYNVNSIMNPILVMCTRARLLLQPLPRQAAGARGRRADHDPPHAVGVPPGAPPELHRLLRAGAGRHHRPAEIEAQYEKQFAEDEWYRHLYRTSYAYHGVHPFYMWYWGAHAHAAPAAG